MPAGKSKCVNLSGELMRCQAELAELRAQIGKAPEGSHPDEQKPRAATWHEERMHWMAEVERLKAKMATHHPHINPDFPYMR